MALTHAHSPAGEARLDPRTRRLLTAIVAAIVLATLVGLFLLWPEESSVPRDPALGAPADLVDGTVREVGPKICTGTDPAAQVLCEEQEIEITSGATKGEVVTLETPIDAPNRLEAGDRIVLGYSPDDQPETPDYYFADYQRRRPLTILVVIFVVAVVALGRWLGVRALGALGLSLLVLIWFVLPSIIEGHSPVAVALVGSSAVMLVALYLSHGVNAGTTAAVLGTTASLGIIAALAAVFVATTQFTGLAGEEQQYLQAFAGQIDLEGLLLGGIVIGSLGVLDDVTITQAAAVAELRATNPEMGPVALYRSALRIGRDHIASTVNTLVLAYAGAALPVLLLLRQADVELGDVLTGEVVAVEIVRTLVGSIGLVASVPITTGLAAFVLTRTTPVEAGTMPPGEPRRRPSLWPPLGVLKRRPRAPRERRPRTPRARPWQPSRHELEWRDEPPDDG